MRGGAHALAELKQIRKINKNGIKLSAQCFQSIFINKTILQ